MSRTGRLLVALSLLLLLLGAGYMAALRLSDIDEAPTFTFAVLADPRAGQSRWRNALAEIRDQNINPALVFGRAEIILAVGDIDPLEDRYQDFQEIFADSQDAPVFLPVMGNHDIRDRDFMLDAVLPDADFVSRRDSEYVNYYADWRNVRLIAVDGYSDLGEDGVINDDGRAWVEEAIESAPEEIEHIFVTFHVPAFPRHRHLTDSFNADPLARDAFWHMLVSHSERVRAVFVGHTHHYSRLRVLDPAGVSANDPDIYPDEVGGIYQVDVGAAGNAALTTLVLVQIDSEDVSFRTLEAEYGPNKPFSVIDEWQVSELE